MTHNNLFFVVFIYLLFAISYIDFILKFLKISFLDRYFHSFNKEKRLKTKFRGADKPLFPFLHRDLYRLLDEDHLNFFLRSILADYDLSPIINSYRSDNVGRAPFDPGKMVLSSSSLTGVVPSRKIERLFEDSIGDRTIIPANHPDHSTINRFRKNNEDALAALFMDTFKKVQDIGLVDPGVEVVDGTKMKANAALSANESDCGRINRETVAIDREYAPPVVEPLFLRRNAPPKSGDEGLAMGGGRRPEKSIPTSRKRPGSPRRTEEERRRAGPDRSRDRKEATGQKTKKEEPRRRAGDQGQPHRSRKRNHEDLQGLHSRVQCPYRRDQEPNHSGRLRDDGAERPSLVESDALRSHA